MPRKRDDPNDSLEDKVAKLAQLVKALPQASISKATLDQILELSSQIPVQFFPPGWAEMIYHKFAPYGDLADLKGRFEMKTTSMLRGEDFDKLVPASGWLHDYIEYTKNTEPPTVFHFFVGLCVLGATFARRISMPKGSGDLYPNLNVVLVAPAGKCKKTTACNLGVNLFRRIGGNILADKVTPEAVIESFKQTSSATGLIYAPEWAVFIGKQQYMEGLVPMLTALFDCPDVWTSSTIMRATTQLKNVAISHLAATTIDWMQTSIAKDAFSGGFMSRLVFIIQHDTPRSFPLPPPLDQATAKRLADELAAMQRVKGSVTLSPDAEKWYVDWYHKRSKQEVEKQLAGYFERKPDRLLQISMLLNASEDFHRMEIPEAILIQADEILNWIERLLPSTFNELAATTVGDEQHRMLKQIRAAKNGTLTRQNWVRMNRSRMNTDQFRKSVETLRAAGFVVYDSTKDTYFLLPAGYQES